MNLPEEAFTTAQWSPPPASTSAAQWTRVIEVGRSLWPDEVVRSMSRLRSLADDWDGYGSPSPSGRLLDWVENLVPQLGRLSPFVPLPSVVPVPGGGVRLEWVRGPRELELEASLGTDETRPRVTFLRSEDGAPFSEGPIRSIPDLVGHVLWVVEG